jgi:catechol 2,3-dioxygenase-like lactoylglutathione lyase family enzyme
MEINGIAHISITVSNFEICVPFYEKLLSFLGMKQAFKGDNLMYYVGGKTALAVERCDEKYKHEKFVQKRVGLHHICFRAQFREDIDLLYQFLLGQKITIVHPPEDGPWAPGYYSILFEDPDGIRLEANYVPGKGIFAEGAKFNPADDYS